METGISYADLRPDSADRFVPLRRELGVSTFGLNQMVLRPGERGRIHAHRHQEEVYIVLEGTLTLLIDGVPTELNAGRVVRVGPEVRRQLANYGPDRLVLIALGGASPHEGRDGIAFADWDDVSGGAPQDLPAPDNIPDEQLRRA
jgi:mannose-6-phosphate isomerase-like protein (cupin superfamily)